MNYRGSIYRNYLDTLPFKLPTSVEDFKPRVPHLSWIVKNFFPKDRNARVIDLGCGHGALVYVARSLGYTNVWGIDASPQQVECAKRLGIEGIEQGDILEVLDKELSASYDCIVAFDVLEHFTKDEFTGIVAQVYRVLKPGGRVILHLPNAEGPFGGRQTFGDFTHEITFTPRSIKQVLGAIGFRRIACYEDAPVPHGVVSFTRRVLWVCIKCALHFYLAVETGDPSWNSIFTQTFLTIAVRPAK